MLIMMGILLALAILRAWLRRRWAAIAIVFPVLTVWGIGELSQPQILSLAVNGLLVAAIIYCLLRFGLLAAIAGTAANTLVGYFPLTTNLSAWYAPATYYALICILILAFYGFIISMPRGRRGLASHGPPAL
jgi:hypothetical protein